MSEFKKSVVFYTGYSPTFSGEQGSKCYGSELCCKNIAERLAVNYEVHVFSDGNIFSVTNNDVNYHNFGYYNTFQKKYEQSRGKIIDVLVISRYINFFIHNVPKAKKIIFWSHDTTVQPYYDGVKLHGEGGPFTINLLNKIDTYITLTKTHKEFVYKWLSEFKELTDQEKSKFIVLGNAFNPKLFQHEEEKIERVENRFIYCSDPNRGLGAALDVIKRLHDVDNSVTLEVYYGELSQELKEKAELLPFVHINGKLEQSDLIKEMYKSDMLLYPSFFFETYCMVALECQMAGVIPITSDFGALKDTVADRGITVSFEDVPYEQFIDKMVEETLKLMNDPERKLKMRLEGLKFASEQTYDNIVPEPAA